MLSLKKFQPTGPGMADLLNYAALIDPGIVHGKNGALMAGFFFNGKDSATATNSERNYDAAMVSTYLSKFDEGWSIWVDAVRLPAPGYTPPEQSFFPDPVSALIDAERREMFERMDNLYETEYAMVIQYLPPPRRSAKLGEMFYNDSEFAESSPGTRILVEFKKRLSDFQEGLKDILNLKRMGSTYVAVDGEAYESDELVNYLHFTITGDLVALRIPSCPMFMDAWIGSKDMWTGNIPKVGDKFIACVAIDGFPEISRPGILSVLEGLPIAYRWSSRYIFRDRLTVIETLKRFRRHWEQKVRGFLHLVIRTDNGAVDIDAVSMTSQVDRALGDARSDKVMHGDYTPVVVLMSENRGLLMDRAAYVKKEIERRGFGARVEEMNTQDAWLGSLPGHTYPNVRRPMIHTLSLATVLPLSAIWPGLRENPCSFYPEGSPPLMHAITAGSTPFRLNLHVGDVAHTLIFGPTGVGKSLKLGLLVAQAMRYRSRPRPDGSTAPATIMAFDKGGSMYALCKAVGGQHYDIGSDDPADLALCPLADIDTDSGMMWTAEWIGTCFHLQTGTYLNPDQKNEVWRALKRMQEKPRNARSVYDFVMTVQKQEVRDAIKHYTIDGAMGHLLDGKEDSLKMPSLTVFEIDELMRMGDKNALPVMLYLFHRFIKSLTGQPAFLIIDEGWVLLGNAAYRDQLSSFFKELRRANCAVIFATQSLSAAVNSGILDTLIEQCPTKIFLPNHEADLRGTAENPGPAEYYAMFGLNKNEIQALKTAQYKKQYYYKSPLGRRMYELGVGPLAMSFVGVSDKDSIRDVKACEEKHGADWPIYWLKQRGVDYAKYTK